MQVVSPRAQVEGTQHSQTPARRATGLTSSKIRDSCQACALSKVKCHKEKPICSRCARRGITCDYFVTKRPGRKRDKSQPTNNESNGDTINVIRPDFPGGQENWLDTTISTNCSALSGNNTYSTSLDLFNPTSPGPGSVSRAECTSPSNKFSGFSMPLDPSLSPRLVGMSNEFDENFFTSPLGFLEDFEFIQERDDLEKLLLPDKTNSKPISEASSVEPPNISKGSSPSSNGQALSSRDTSVCDGSDSKCCCLVQALDFMKELSSNKSPVSALSNGLDDDTIMSNVNLNINSSAQTVVIENKHTIKAVSNMLQCSCAEDSYLLTTLAMIVFKILGRYAAAARNQHGEGTEGGDKFIESTSTKEQMRQISSWRRGNGDEGLGRIVAQLVLSELHHMQRLVNQLSPRLKARGLGFGLASEGGGGGTPGSKNSGSGGDYQVSSLSDSEPKMAPFSTSTLDQIEIDLRKSLCNLSSEIINMLRQC